MLLTRRQFLKLLVGTTIIPFLPRFLAQAYTCHRSSILLNDQHTRLNPTHVADLFHPHTVSDIRHSLSKGKLCHRPLIAAGGFHSAGGQQMISKGSVLETRHLCRVSNFDSSKGLLEVEAGIQWPELMQYLVDTQKDWTFQWGIRQKPTGTDRISMGGSLSSNIHGKGLNFSPLIGDVESFKLIDAKGNLTSCSREQNPELFSLVIGGYGLFGIIYSVTLRLQARERVRRMVQVLKIDNLVQELYRAKMQGAGYGDFQFEIDPESDGFLTRGIMSTYHPLKANEANPQTESKPMSEDVWADLVYQVHVNKTEAFKKYSQHYLESNGQVDWSDSFQTGPYRDGYHSTIDKQLGGPPASECLTEVYVDPKRLADFMKTVAEDFRKNKVDVIFGTVRMIQADRESFLPWARRDYACVIFNLHVLHTAEGIEHAKQAFQRLIDYAIALDGSYYLTYHRYARKDQVLACYSQFPEFLELKKKYDPKEVFRSNWYNHYAEMFANS